MKSAAEPATDFWEVQNYTNKIPINTTNDDVGQAKGQMQDNLPIIAKREEAKKKILRQKYFAENISGGP